MLLGLCDEMEHWGNTNKKLCKWVLFPVVEFHVLWYMLWKFCTTNQISPYKDYVYHTKGLCRIPCLIQFLDSANQVCPLSTNFVPEKLHTPRWPCAAINTIEDPYEWGPLARVQERDDIQPQEQFFDKNAIDRILVRNKGGFGEVQDWMYEYADKLYNYEGVEYPIPSCTDIIKND